MPTISRGAVLAGMAGIAAVPLFSKRAVAKSPVDESRFVPIGDIEQWVGIQGEDNRNPIILFLHGGPAEAQSPFLKEFAPWEHDFTVVNWDQRGSGKTYGKNGAATPDMTVERMAADAIEVAQYALTKLAKPKLILVGHSWGALLGLYVIQRQPKLFSAFVGTGQPVNWTLTIEDRERWARAQAAMQGDTAALEALDDAASLPISDMKRVMASNEWRMSPSDKQYLSIQRDFIGAPPFPTEGDVADWIAGSDFTGPKLWPTIVGFDARKQFPTVPIPFLVIEGRDDHTVSLDAAKQYVEQVSAPRKAFVSIEGGHFACFTNPGAFIDALERFVSALPPR
jgi:pimeloyl-ACP methyl ester carboxylesterase